MKRGFLLATMMSVVLLFGCANASVPVDMTTGQTTANTANTTTGQVVSDIVTVSSIKAKYGAVSSDNAVAPLYNMAPDEAFDFKFKCNILNEYCEDDFVSVHTHKLCNPESLIYTYANYEETSDGGCVLTISPISGVLETKTDDGKSVWGSAPMYYIAIWYDMEAETLTKLEEPIIIPFTIKHQVQAPKVKGVVDSNGCFSLRWEAVPGADEYRVYTLSKTANRTGYNNEPIEGAQNGYNNCSLIFMEAVTDTRFANFAGEGGNVTTYTRSVSGREYIISQNECVNSEYYVSAVVDGVESGFDKAVETADLKLPVEIAAESDIMFKTFSDVAELPSTLPVVNIDGSISERNVMYTFQLEDTYIEGYKSKEYAYVIEGTAITGCVSMDVKDKNYEFPEIIGEVTLTGFVEPQNDISALPEDDAKPEAVEAEKGELISKHIEESKKKSESTEEIVLEGLNENIMIFADSSEEEWIALNMANGESEISLEAFPKLQVYDELQDVLDKIYYQNPYVLGLYRYKYNHNTATLHVDYVYDKEEIKWRQQEIYESANEIVDEIIKEGMSETQKQLAIYNYLEENCTYNHDALDNAKKSNYVKTSDATFESAFNAYGILVEKTGVCMSYACAYKLLCNMSGVECDVVTGYLDGSLPHAWNGVNVDGDWYQTDITNNKNTVGIPYYLYNSDTNTASETGYTEDDLYELDSKLAEYFSDNTEYEYYHAHNMCATTIEEYQKVISDLLEQNSDVICVRYLGDLPAQSDIIKAVQEVYFRQNRENELQDLSLAVKNGFIVLFN